MSRYNLYDTCTEFDKEDRDDSGESSGDEIKCIIQQGDGDEGGRAQQKDTVSCSSPEERATWIHKYNRYNNEPIRLTVPEYKAFGNEELITTRVYKIKRPVANTSAVHTTGDTSLVLDTNIYRYRNYLLNNIGIIANRVVSKVKNFISKLIKI